MKKNKKETEQTGELYYEMNVEKLVIIVRKGGKVVFQSGQPTNPGPPPPKP